jgi:hypothetical protein
METHYTETVEHSVFLAEARMGIAATDLERWSEGLLEQANLLRAGDLSPIQQQVVAGQIALRVEWMGAAIAALKLGGAA